MNKQTDKVKISGPKKQKQQSIVNSVRENNMIIKQGWLHSIVKQYKLTLRDRKK